VSAPGLAARGLTAGWGPGNVLSGLDLDVRPGEVVAVLGANGSGKSSLLWALAGLLPVRAGTISLAGRRLDRLSTERRAALGVALLPQSRRVFGSLTGLENLEVVELAVGRPDVAAIRQAREAWLSAHPGLAAKLDQPASSLSGGEQQLLAIGRVLSTRPRVLLLDEPSAGLAPPIAEACAASFATAATEDVAVVLVEQNVALARRVATRVLHLEAGRLVADPG
jgi:branched-chain amino acid transport system ATP-binding protein